MRQKQRAKVKCERARGSEGEREGLRNSYIHTQRYREGVRVSERETDTERERERDCVCEVWGTRKQSEREREVRVREFAIEREEERERERVRVEELRSACVGIFFLGLSSVCGACLHLN